MNAGHEREMAQVVSASSEARQKMADWIRITQAPKTQAPDYRNMLLHRYPSGLIDDAEMEALLGILEP